MAAAKPKIHLSQLVDKLSSKTTRLYSFFLGLSYAIELPGTLYYLTTSGVQDGVLRTETTIELSGTEVLEMFCVK